MRPGLRPLPGEGLDHLYTVSHTESFYGLRLRCYRHVCLKLWQRRDGTYGHYCNYDRHSLGSLFLSQVRFDDPLAARDSLVFMSCLDKQALTAKTELLLLVLSVLGQEG